MRVSTIGARVWGMALLAIILSIPAQAQDFRGNITGVVTDPQGAVVPGATVTALHSTTKVSTSAVSNSSGNFALLNLPIGQYTVTFELQGFKPVVRDVEVRVGDRIQMDTELTPGAISETITVTGEAPLLDIASASRGQVIDSEKVQELPLSGRNPFALAHLATGVVGERGNRQSIQLRPFDNGGMDAIVINGGRVRSNEFLLDGAPNTANEGANSNNLAFVPSPDATEEFRVASNTYDAQYGRTGGGTISVSVKSGTNAYHGSAYYYLRDKALNANTYENKVNGIPKGDFSHKQPGFVVGGPIRQNRTFFLYSYEKIKSGLPDVVTATVPTDRERAGDFSQANFVIFDPLTRQPFPGNVIPNDRIDPVSRNLLQYFPTANTTPNSAGQNNFLVTPNTRTDDYDAHIVRVDQVLGGSRLFGRYVHNDRYETRGLGGRAREAATSFQHFRKNDGLTADLTSTFGRELVSTLRGGFTRHQFAINPYANGFDPATLGYPASFTSALPLDMFPAINVNDYIIIGGGGGQYTDSKIYFVQETLSKLHGNHQFKVGGEYRGIRDHVDQRSAINQFQFSRNFTGANPLTPAATSGNAFASFLLGYPAVTTGATATGVVERPVRNYNSNYIALFVQDDWRITRRLTLNAGMRWDYETPVSEADNIANAGFDPSLQSPLVVPGMTVRGGLTFADGQIYKRDLNNFGPRVGLTYQLQEKVILRGGYGLSYLPTAADRGTFNGFEITTPYVASTDGGVRPANKLSNPYPNGLLTPPGSSLGAGTFLGQAFTYHVVDKPTPRFHNWSAGVQIELPWRSVVDASYVGSRTNGLGVFKDINEVSAEELGLGLSLNDQVPNPFAGLLPGNPGLNGPTVVRSQLLRTYPQFAAIREDLRPEGTLKYHSLQARWEKRLSQNFHALLSYTLSINRERQLYLNPQDPDGQLFEQPTSIDRRHNLRISGGYYVPEMADKNLLTRSVLGGWQFNVSGFIRSGVPVAMASTAAQPNNQPPNLAVNVAQIGDPVLSNPTLDRSFNTCTLTAAGVRQNCASADEQPAWQIRAPFTLNTTGQWMEGVYVDEPFYMDFSIFKTFPIHNFRAQFRAEIFNLTNVAQFGAPNTVVTSPDFGRVTRTQANDARSGMLSFRFIF